MFPKTCGSVGHRCCWKGIIWLVGSSYFCFTTNYNKPIWGKTGFFGLLALFFLPADYLPCLIPGGRTGSILQAGHHRIQDSGNSRANLGDSACDQAQKELVAAASLTGATVNLIIETCTATKAQKKTAKKKMAQKTTPVLEN